MSKPTEQTSSEAVHFVADARLLSILGEQLIGSEKVGILELIKNSYDAGATKCVVTIEGAPNLESRPRTLDSYADLPGPIIEVRDNGSGMNRDDIVNGWLRPATSNRGRIKDRLKTERAKAVQRGAADTYDALVAKLRDEHGGRIPLGEKGVGRLATHRLGQHLWLRTKTKDDPLEWELRIDWTLFDSEPNERLDLHKVPLTLRHQAPTASYDSGHGTFIVCYGGRPGYVWTDKALLDLAGAIGAIKSPRSSATFSVTFETPHLDPALLDNPARLTAPFELVAIIDQDGLADIELKFEPPDHLERAPQPFRRIDHLDLRSKDVDYWTLNGARRQPTCGPFLIHVLCWIRIPKWLGPDHREITDYLDNFGGLTIYRDGILAQPAQQTARSDWLGLASQQIKKASKLSYYQLLGEIELEQSQTLALRDKSNREGLIETQAFLDLTELTKAVLSELQFYTRRVRDEWTRSDRTREVSGRSLATATRVANKILTVLADSYDFEKDAWSLKSIDPGLRSERRARASADALKALPDFISLREEERNGLLEAAGFGLAVAVGVHEMSRVAASISSECRSMARKPDSDDLPNRARLAAQRADSLLSEIRRIAPLRTARSEAPQQVSIRKAVEAARTAFASSMDSVKASLLIEGSDFTVAGRFGAISQVFANLVDNSIYWMATGASERRMKVTMDAESRTVLFADTGPGVSEKMQPMLFEPFYSEKSPPSGLGLYICRYYLSQSKAKIRVAKDSERNQMPGAQFLLDFSKSAEAVS